MIPLTDLNALHASIRDELRKAIEGVLESGAFVSGPAVARFEENFASYLGTGHVVGVSSGTSALHLALLALRIGPGDEVIVPAMSFIATAAAVDYTGARPVFVDIDPATFTLDPGGIDAAITERTRAIIPVHLYGQSAEMDPILEKARSHGLAVIEDAAQAHGATYKGRRCGTLCDLGCFSFFPGKNLGALGEGGAVVTDDPELAALIQRLRDWGQSEKGRHQLKGFNYRMDGIQGAVLEVKLRRLDAWNDERRAIARKYAERLSACEELRLPEVRPDAGHVFHVYAVRAAVRDALRSRLERREIATGIHYPRAMHQHECFAGLGYREGEFPVAEGLAREEISLPIYPGLTEAQIDRICGVVMERT